jgi:hypothetical protein
VGTEGAQSVAKAMAAQVTEALFIVHIAMKLSR